MLSIQRTTLIFACIVIVLHIAGYLFPTIFTWGFHSYGFLHPAFLIAAISLSVALILFVKKFDGAITSVSHFMERQPSLFIISVILLFAGSVLLFQVRVPLLGDSFIIIKNFANTFEGRHPFEAPREPLASLYFYIFTALLKAPHYPDILNAFMIGELILGAGLVIATYFIVRPIFVEPKNRFLALTFLLILPYMELFWGYVEVYSTSLFALSIYVLLALLYLRGKISYLPLPIIMLAVVLVHYLNGLLLPSLLYLTYTEYKARGMKRILSAIGMAGSIVIVIVLGLGEKLKLFLPPPGLTPYLSVFSGDAYQAYSLLSAYHASDLANLFLLLSPSSIILIFIGIKSAGRDFLRSSTTIFFMFALIPALMFLFIAKFDLPMAIDWDVFTPYFYVLAVFGVYCFSHIEDKMIAILPMLIIVSLFQSVGWFLLNSTVVPAIERAKTFIDHRVISREGTYQMYFHFTEYYDAIQDTNNQLLFSRQYVTTNPNDRRGHSNYVSYLAKYSPVFNDSLTSAFEQWRAAFPNEKEITAQYTNFLMYYANLNRNDGHYQKAIHLYRRAIEVTPQTVGAYNEIGMSYCAIKDTAEAISWYHKALSLDSTYSAAYVNLANLYDETGHADSALDLYNKASLFDPNNPDIYLNIAIVHMKLGNSEKIISFLQRAARLGSIDAQQGLRRSGHNW